MRGDNGLVVKLAVCAALVSGGLSLAGCGDDAGVDGNDGDTHAGVDGGGDGDGDGDDDADGGTDSGMKAMGTPIGPDGGDVSGPNGVRLTIPAGALSETVGIAVVVDSATNAGAAYTVLGEVYQLLPDGQPFDAPVTVALPYDVNDIPFEWTEADLFALFSSDGGTTWEVVKGTAKDGVFSFELTRFGLVAVAVKTVGACTVQFDGSLELDDASHELVYNARGRLTSDIRGHDNDRDGTVDWSNATLITYDASDRETSRVEETRDAGGTATHRFTTTTSHDASGHVTTVVKDEDATADGTIEVKQTTTQTWTGDELTRVVHAIADGDGVVDMTITTTTTYDASGRAITVVKFTDATVGTSGDARAKDTYVYDSMGHVTEHTYQTLDPATSAPMYSTKTTTTYDARGMPLTELREDDDDGNGTVDSSASTTYTYDASSRLVTTVNLYGEVKTTYTDTYDTQGFRTSHVIDNDSNNDGTVDYEQTSTFTNDARGNPTIEVVDTDTNNDGAVDDKTTYVRTFDASDRLLTENRSSDIDNDGTVDRTFSNTHVYDAYGQETMRTEGRGVGFPANVMSFDATATYTGTCAWLPEDTFERLWVIGF